MTTLNRVPALYPHLIRAQAKFKRRMMGEPRPIWCPICEQYTNQRIGKHKKHKLDATKSVIVIYTRICIECGIEFTRAESRKVIRAPRQYRHIWQRRKRAAYQNQSSQ